MGEIVRGRFLVRRWGPPVDVVEDGAVYVEDGQILAADDYAVLRRASSRCADAGRRHAPSHAGPRQLPFARPRHHHAPARHPRRARRDPFVGLRRGLSVDPFADVLLGCVRQLEAGITATMHLDSNYGGPPELYEQRLTKIIRAYRTSGIRFSVGVGIRDQNTFGPYVGDEVFFARLPPEAQAEVAQWSNPVMPIADYLGLCGRLHDVFPGVDLQFAPVNPDGCTDDLAAGLREQATARRVRINIHLLETPYQRAHAVERWGQTGVEWLARTGFLGPDVICAHCVWLTGRDVELMRETGAVVAHNPSSNLRLRSGVAPVRHMADHGVSLALGTDNLGMNDDGICSRRHASRSCCTRLRASACPPSPAETVLGWATECGAEVLGVSGLGRLAPGSPADLVLARLGPIARSIDGPESIAAAVVQWLRPPAVDMVMVAGRVVVRGGRYALADRDEVERAAYDTVKRWAQGPAVRMLKDAVTDLYRAWPEGAASSRGLRSRN